MIKRIILIKIKKLVIATVKNAIATDNVILHCDYDTTPNIINIYSGDSLNNEGELDSKSVPLINFTKEQLDNDAIPMRQAQKIIDGKPGTVFVMANKAKIQIIHNDLEGKVLLAWYSNDELVLDYYFYKMHEENEERLQRIERSKTPHFISRLEMMKIDVIGHQRPVKAFA